MENSSQTPTPEKSSGQTKPKRPPRPNYAAIHSRPLPVNIFPLPAFHPTQPLSLISLIWALVAPHIAPSRYPSHSTPRYKGVFDPATRSVHVTDEATVRALWEAGFFGKGSLSRSEPSWMAMEKRRRVAAASGSMTSEEVTRLRREERREFKRERAKKEREAIEAQLKAEGKANGSVIENGSLEQVNGLTDSRSSAGQVESKDLPNAEPMGAIRESKTVRFEELAQKDSHTSERNGSNPSHQSEFSDTVEIEPIENQEHLQLTFEESFFLTYGLGSLSIYESPSSPNPLTTRELLRLFCASSSPTTPILRPDNRFLINYVVYHHFRSLGWVVRSGVKFAVDFLLYNRGPAFAHAEFAIVVVPEFADRTKTGDERGSKDWWWLHCINRVQAQVVKHLVLAYVQVPSDLEIETSGDEIDIGRLLRRYKVREIILKRWNPNRSRD